MSRTFGHYAAAVRASFRRDLLRALRLIFLLCLFVVTCATLGQFVAQDIGTGGLSTAVVVLSLIFGVRVIEYRQVRPVPVWVDAVELVGVFAVLAQLPHVHPAISPFFMTVLFRAAVGRLGRLLPLLVGYEVVWLAAAATFPDNIVLIPGAMISLPLVGLLVYGTRHLMMRLQEQHQAQSALLDGILRRLPFPVVVTDRAGVVVLANPAANALTGWSADGTQALSDLRVHDAAERPVDLRSVAATTAESGTGAAGLEVRLGRPDGSVAHVMVETVPMAGDPGHSHGAVIALLDITAQRLYEEHLHHAAYFDGLTGLPNRAMLWQHFTAVVRSAVPYAVLLIDLDKFKAVNDTYGHQAGDELLRGVARRLTDAVGSTATVARLGGDEFAVLLPGTSAESAEAAAVAVRESFAEPFRLSCGTLSGHGTVGVALGAPGQSPDEVIAAADTAMYSAKPSGRRHQPHARTAVRTGPAGT